MFLADSDHHDSPHSMYRWRLVYRSRTTHARLIQDARAAFDVAFMYTNEDSETVHFLLLIKVCHISLAYCPPHHVFRAIALFNADRHDEANLPLKELITGCPKADTVACHIVKAYLRVQLGLRALDRARHNEAADHFTAAVNSSNLSSKSDIHQIYEDLVVLFGWDLKSLWLTAHQKWCQAFLCAGKVNEALESHKYMMDNIDETTKANSLDWSATFKQECSGFFLTNGDTALAASDYDRAIDLYSQGKMLWTEALLDAQKVTKLNSLSYLGYNLKYAALHGAQRYDETIQAFRIMLSKLDSAPDTETRKLRQQYLSPSKVDRAIRKVIDKQLDNTPLRVLDTPTSLLCSREAQIRTFKMSVEYKELVSSAVTHRDIQIQMKHIEEVVMTYFRYDKIVYDLDPVGGITKLQSFCKTARDLRYRWAWSDTCCIDKNNNVELQESVNFMFVWYHLSALTVVYLSDVPPWSKSGALTRSAWNTRGWTVQEFLAPKVILFHQKDWTLYLNNRTPNQKESVAIMQELENATGIDRQTVLAFRPGMREDIAYSLSGVFGVRLHVDYGEKQKSLGRLLQEIVAQSGDITALDWVGESSVFNSCLPADIISYAAPPYALPSLSEDKIQTAVSLLRKNPVAVDSASRLHDQLDHTSSTRFAHHRLHLPCIVFPVREARLRPGQD
ncbi:hypothetical protein BDR07DRAFT_1492731 [Suillus spraguei]|nr:hypothetical protein BDR07DRAFT_1492731 [Suillus spraguei]